jgi:PAS domain S-box-containing protein
MDWIKNIRIKSYVIAGICGFYLALGIGALLTYKEYQLHELEEKEKVKLTAELIHDRVERVTETTRSTANILEFLIRTNGLGKNFEETGRNLIEHIDLIHSIQYLEKGVIVAAYPLEENAEILGYDILEDPIRREEALLTIQREELFFAGPIDLREGPKAIIARLPIFEEGQFKGFVVCLIYWEAFTEELLWGFSDNSEFMIDLIKVDQNGENPKSLLEKDFSEATGPELSFNVPEGNLIVKIQLSESLTWSSLIPAIIFRIASALLVGFLTYKFAQQPYILSRQVKEKTKELSISNQRFELAIQATSEIIWDWDMIKNETFRSDNFENILGYSKNDLINNDSFWGSIIHPDDLESISQYLQKGLEGKEDLLSKEYRLKKSDGTYIYVLDKGLIIRDENGKPIRMIGSTQDINERKLAEKEIEDQKQRLSNVIESTGAGTWEWNVQTGKTQLNEIWANLLGYTLEELEPTSFTTWTDLVHPDDLKEALEILENYFSGKTSEYKAEFRMRHKNGGWVWILDKGKTFSYTPEGKPLMMFGTHVDITSNKLREEEIKSANQKLQAANEELKSFASVASHDIKEPLRMISSFLQLLEKKYIDQLDEKGLQYIDFAVNGAKRLTSLIDNMMDYSRVGFDESQLGPVDLNTVVEEVIQLQNQVLHAKKAEITVGDLPVVLGIKTPLKSVFINLITNALKYQKEGNSPKISIDSKNLGEECQISIEDNGIGIEKEYFDRIFKLFGRLHRIDEYSGAGIGLAICKKVIDQHQGKIWVDSEPGKGSKFHIILPLYESRKS